MYCSTNKSIKLLILNSNLIFMKYLMKFSTGCNWWTWYRCYCWNAGKCQFGQRSSTCCQQRPHRGMSALLVTMKPSVLSCFQVNQYQKKFVNQYMKQFTCQSVNQSNNQSISQIVSQSAWQSGRPQVSKSVYPFMHLPVSQVYSQLIS